jgi:hypothetical protein
MGMKARVNELVFVTLVVMASGALKHLDVNFVLNVNFCLSFFFPLSFESRSRMIFFVRGYTP